MSRYPYTYASDLLRMIPDLGPEGCKLSRSEASSIRQKISEILGLDDEEVAKKLADYYQEHEEELSQASADRFLKVVGIGDDIHNPNEELLRQRWIERFGIGIPSPVQPKDLTPPLAISNTGDLDFLFVGEVLHLKWTGSEESHPCYYKGTPITKDTLEVFSPICKHGFTGTFDKEQQLWNVVPNAAGEEDPS